MASITQAGAGRLKKLLFALTTVSVLLAGAEVASRLIHGWHKNWLHSHCWHPQLGWALRPGWTGSESWTGGPSRINPQGIRDDRPVGSRAPGEKRLLVLGDSVTFGALVKTADAFPAQLQRALRTAGINWRVLNGGVTGYDPLQEAEWLDLYGWGFEPDVLAVAFCRNDVEAANRTQFRHQEATGAAARWLAERSLLAHNLQQALWSLQARLGMASATRAGPPSADAPLNGWPLVEHAYRRIARRAAEKNVPVVLLIYPTLDLLAGRKSDDLSAQLTKLGKELGWQVIDLDPAFRDDPVFLFLHDDPVHPSPQGYRRAAVYAASELARLRTVSREESP